MKTARFIANMLIVFVFAASAAVSQAATATASLSVSVVIRPWLKLASEQHIHSYQVTRNDMAKGYVDIPKAATLKIKTNERKEIVVMVANEGAGTLVINGGHVSSGGNDVVRMGMSQSGKLLSKTIDARLILPKDVAEGTYPLLLSLSIL